MKKMFFLILAAVLIVSLSACSEQNKQVYLYGVTDLQDIFVDNVAVFHIPSIDANSQLLPPEHDKIFFNGEIIPLQYVETKWNYHIYSSSDNNISCYYHAVTDDLWQISVVDASSVLPLSDCTGESQYIDLIKEVVADYCDENWSDYTYSCETTILRSGDDWSSNTPYTGFLTPSAENEKVSSYTFKFTRHINGYSTSDYIRAYHNPMVNHFSIRFSEHAFDSIKRVSVNSGDIESRIDAFVQQYVDASKYPEIKYSIKSPTLITIDSKLYYQCSLELITGSRAQLVPIIVEI